MESPRTIISFLLVGQSYANAASGVVYIWYHFTTLQEEVDLFWKAGYSSACVLFLANRYLALVLAGYSLGWMDSVYALDTPHGIVFQSCVAVAVSKAALNALQYAVWAAFSALRTHALGQRRARTALVAVLSLVPVFSLSLTQGGHVGFRILGTGGIHSSRNPQRRHRQRLHYVDARHTPVHAFHVRSPAYSFCVHIIAHGKNGERLSRP
ncbi:hypothetical protein BD413DRAFT_272687 [Trametes elegans]|nr:hypothetical protein BD413DRAFT_272687 [Trametes elegans]